jgi:hypothetical protein
LISVNEVTIAELAVPESVLVDVVPPPLLPLLPDVPFDDDVEDPASAFVAVGEAGLPPLAPAYSSAPLEPHPASATAHAQPRERAARRTGFMVNRLVQELLLISLPWVHHPNRQEIRVDRLSVRRPDGGEHVRVEWINQTTTAR